MIGEINSTSSARFQCMVATAVVTALSVIGSSVMAEGAPVVSEGVTVVPHKASVFTPDPSYADKPYKAEDQIQIYGGKRAVVSQRPLLEIGRELYTEGAYDKGLTLFGEKNTANPHLIVYGDWRTGVGSNDNGVTDQSSVVTRLNLEVDAKITATERIHTLLRPIVENGRFTGAIDREVARAALKRVKETTDRMFEILTVSDRDTAWLRKVADLVGQLDL